MDYESLIPAPDHPDCIPITLAWIRLVQCTSELEEAEKDVTTWREVMEEQEALLQHEIDSLIKFRDRGLTGWDQKKESKLAKLQEKLSDKSRAERLEFYKELRRTDIRLRRTRCSRYRTELNRLLGLEDSKNLPLRAILPEKETDHDP